MNEEILPPFAAGTLRSFPEALRRALKRLRRRRPAPAPAADLGLRSRAASAIREYADAHSTLFERAQRLEEKVERLERAGTPSESARNRAERARREVEASLAALRASFAHDDDVRRAFDREVALRYPSFRPPGENL
jgi:DNA repair exonuclease SbcCD ATPase subunit